MQEKRHGMLLVLFGFIGSFRRNGIVF